MYTVAISVKKMNFKRTLSGVVIFVLAGCHTKQPALPITGTWELVSATTTEKDSTFSTFDPKHKMIKIINPTHFAFLNHAVGAGDSAAHEFSAGGGAYTLVDSIYTEHLDYFNDKKWENNKFEFRIKLVKDTLIQKGIEKIDKLGIDHVIIEKYKRISR